MKEVKSKILIKDVAPTKAIAAFTDAPMLKIWWGVERSYIEKRTGGIYTLAWNISDKGFGFVSSGIINVYSPNGTLEIEKFIYLNPERPILGPMTLTIKAKKKEGSTQLHICQSGYREGSDWDWYYEAVKKAWPIALKNLKAFLEHK